jgi:hypothetical protein
VLSLFIEGEFDEANAFEIHALGSGGHDASMVCCS